MTLQPFDFFQLFVLPGLIEGLWATGLVAYGLFCMLPALRAAGARPAAMLAGWLLIAVSPLGAALDAFIGLPFIWFIVVSIVILAVGGYPKLLVTVTGGPRPLEANVASLFAAVDAAGKSFEIGDVEAWQAALEDLDRARSPQLDRYIDLVQRYAREEVGRRAGSRHSSRETLMELKLEATRIRSGVGPPGLLIAAVLVLCFLVAASPSVAFDLERGVQLARTCPEALDRVDAARRDAPEVDLDAWPLSHLVLVDPGAPATTMWDGSLNLERAALSRHNPRARDLLEENGFGRGYLRAWDTADGRLVDAEILAFGTADGAWAFHRAMTAYACGYSNQAFVGPADSVGLRVLYGTGDPIREQLTWVDGTMRVQVSRSFETEPADHAEIVRLAMSQLEQLSHPE
jgi:hypothetical protein